LRTLLIDLYRHQAWADARHLNAIAAHPVAGSDETIRNRLQHVYTVQQFFLWMTSDRGGTFVPPPAPADLHGFITLVRQYHEEAVPFVERLPDMRLADPVENPFAPSDAPRLKVAQALTQCAMHSHYHRGQNATRLRELGGEPPLTDLIVWYWSGCEQPHWPIAV
jgi:uncharacterized damage-inducible protein DinB